MHPEVIHDIQTVFGNGIKAIPQNLSKNSAPARILKNNGFSKYHLHWLIRDGYKGFIASHTLIKNREFKSWLDNRKTRTNFRIKPTRKAMIFIEK